METCILWRLGVYMNCDIGNSRNIGNGMCLILKSIMQNKPHSSVKNLKRILYLSFGFFFGFVMLSVMFNPVSGETVSMKDMRYEIYSCSNQTYNQNVRSLIYDNYFGGENKSVNEFDYYDLDYADDSNTNFMLIDTNVFNMSKMDNFWIEYYNPTEKDLTLTFSYSYVFGNDTPKYMGAFNKIDYFGNKPDGFRGLQFKPNLPNSHIQFYYSDNNNLIYVDDLYQGSLYTSDIINHDYKLEYKECFFNVTLPKTGNKEYIHYSINLDHNYNAYFPKLALYNEIWLINVSQCNVIDYGFKTDKLPVYYYGKNYTITKTYGKNEFAINVNVTNEYDFTTINIDTMVLMFSSYDTNNIYEFNLKGYQIGGVEWDFVGSISQYNALIGGFTVGMSNFRSGLAGGIHTQYGYTGQNIIFNKIDTYITSKYNLNQDTLVFPDRYYFQSFVMEYKSEKGYYGSMCINDYATIDITKTNGHLDYVTTEKNNIDYWELDKSKNDFELIGGDWGYFDDLRKGFNQIGEVIFSAFDLLSPILSPLFDILDEPINVILSTLAGLAQSVFDLFEVIIGLILTLLADIMVVITEGFADILAELGLSGFILDLLNLVIGVSGVIINLITFIVGLIADWVFILIDLMSLAIVLFQTGLVVYLMIIMIITINRYMSAPEENFMEITQSFIELFFYPLKLFVQMIITVVRWTFDAIPF